MLQCHFLAPWVSTFNSCIDNELSSDKNNTPFITFQLATVDNISGFPRNRTLVYRGWLFNNKSSNVITFATDKRMNKYQELLANDKFEAVFYFPHVRKQFRFRGRARLINDEYQPEIDLTAVQNGMHLMSHDNESIMTTNTNASIFEGKISQDDTTNTTTTTATNSPTSPIVCECKNNGTSTEIQKQPITSALLSPSIANDVYDDMSQISYIQPTKEEWNEEIKRQWSNLSKQMKKSYRKPTPKQPITDESAKL
ncbi:uncharacterized protein SPAPADRAFT_63482, partial [Spathaspora passalidarum NRRL Y-27907]